MTSAKCPLIVVIIGGGLCGLSSAVALTRSGHSVTVLEMKDSLSEVGAGIQVQPNSTRVLYSWGLKEQIERLADMAGSRRIRRYATGEVLRELKSYSDESGFPTWLIYRPDLQKMLYDCATAVGVDVRFNAKVIEIDLGGPSVLCENGSTIDADLVLVADGIGSKNRKYVLSDEDVQPLVLLNAYRILIPRDKMLKDAETASLMTDPYRQLWLGPQRNVVAYPISRGKYFNVVLEHPGEAVPGIWNKAGDVNKMKEEYKHFEPAVQKIMDLAESCMDWTLARLPPLPRWSDASGRVLLVGDAAHATTPQLAQGAGMAIEDGAVLAECLASITSKEGIQSATSAFVALRKDRVEKVQQVSWDNSYMFTLDDGPEQEARDRRWRGDTTEPAAQLTEKDFVRRKFLEWLNGYDAIAEARAFVAKSSL